jgi:CSLREA domain-containing protein
MATITGTTGNDQGASQLNGTSDADIINGLAGNDHIEGLEGADQIDGGEGTDRLYYTNSNAAVVVNLLAGTASGGHAEGDTFSNIEGVLGSAFGDTLTGDAGANGFSGQAGNDVIEGGGGADVIDGGNGVNVADSDTASYASSSAGVTVNLATFSGSGGDAEGDEIYNTENITGSAHADTLTGDGNANILTGGGGNDSLNGAGGNDTLNGGAGDDTAVFSVTRASATITQSGSNIVVASADGTDTLTDVEFLQFSDETVSVSSLFPSNTIQVTTFEDVVDANDGVTSLREAITQANAAGTQTIVQLSAGTYSVPGDTLNITGNVILRGAGSTQTIISDLENSQRLLHVSNGGTFSLQDLTLSDGLNDGDNSGNNVGFDRTYNENDFIFRGGALFNDRGSVSITNSVIQSFGSNTVELNRLEAFLDKEYLEASEAVLGGAVFNAGGTLDITGSSFFDNKATKGGAIYADGGTVTIDSTVFDANSVNNVYVTNYKFAGGRPAEWAFGAGAAIYSKEDARVDIFEDKFSSGTSTTFTKHVSQPTGYGYLVAPTDISLIEGNGAVYLDPAISVDGNTENGLNGVVRDTPFGSAAAAASAAQAALAAENTPLRANTVDPAVLTLLQSVDLSAGNAGLNLVSNAILSQSATEIVFQLSGYRLVVNGSDLSYAGDPLTLAAASPQSAADAAAGIVNSITLQTVDGSATVGTATGLSTTFQSVATGLAVPQADGTYAAFTDTLGTSLSQAGGTAADTLTGTASTDILNGNAGNDSITGAGGNDTIDGGADTDTANFTGSQSDYVVFTRSDGRTMVADITEGRDGKDTLSNVEILSFGGTSVSLSTALIEPADADSSAYQVYRFYNTQSGSHFFTTSLAERNSVIENLDILNYEGNAFDSNVTDVNGSAVFRFYNTQNGVHFYTVNAEEAQQIRDTLDYFNDEGIAYYASTDASGGGTALYRFYNTQNGSHFFTISAEERDTIIATLGQYTYEGVAYYVDLA